MREGFLSIWRVDNQSLRMCEDRQVDVDALEVSRVSLDSGRPMAELSVVRTSALSLKRCCSFFTLFLRSFFARCSSLLILTPVRALLSRTLRVSPSCYLTVSSTNKFGQTKLFLGVSTHRNALWTLGSTCFTKTAY